VKTISIAIVCVLAASAYANGKSDAAYHDGERLYAAKQYLAAAAKFEEAYNADPDPAVLFNIAQAYRLGHACAQASRFYHRFLDAAPSPPEPEKLQRYIDDMDACAKREAEVAEPRVIHDTQVVEKTKYVGERDPGRRMRTIGAIVGGVGLVAAAVGGYFTYRVHDIQSDREAVCAAGCIWGEQQERINNLDSRGHRAERIETIAYATAGVAVIAGVTLYVIGSRRKRDTLVALPLPGGGAASWQFDF
jgi:tetratricopeptide (TPR) repeat protein